MHPPFLKAWRWVGAFGPDVMLCAARAAVGAAHVGWWAVWDREAAALHKRTRHGWRGVTVEPGRAAVRQPGVAIDLALTPAGAPVCAGAGQTPAGVRVAWNLVEGMDVAEHAVWIDGAPHPVAAVTFELAGVAGLRFTAEATRARRENRVVIASDYEQPFGCFAGELPVAGPLAEAWGVMERHAALW